MIFIRDHRITDNIYFSPILIPTLKRMKFGQSIVKKASKPYEKQVPTMGGLTFLISIIITSIIAIIFVDHSNPIFVTICNNRFWSYWIY